MAVNLEYQVQKAFMMLRTGMLPDDAAIQVIQQFVPKTKQHSIWLRELGYNGKMAFRQSP
jgi:hypothetical protein